MEKLPAEYLNAMKEQLGEAYTGFIQSFTKPVQSALRVNSVKVSGESYERLSPFKLKPVPWISNGYYYEDACAPAKHPHYYAGLYYMQESSAMTPASRLLVEPGDKVLDLCAAPGGKATELGARLKGKGFLLANDISNSRAKSLLKNLELSGIPNIFVTSETPEKLCGCYQNYFDKILLDAPCSGEGMFRKDRKMAEHWTGHGPSYYAPIQHALIRQAVQMLKPGGLLLYSTCTFSIMENEQIVEGLLNDHPEMELMEISPYYEGFTHGIVSEGRADMKRCVRIYPHCMKGEGHFLSLLKKNGEPVTEEVNKPKNCILPKAAKEFLEHCSVNFSEGYFHLQDERLYYLNSDMLLQKRLRYLRTGLLLGTLVRNRFDPSQAFAMALRADQFDSVILLSSEDDRTIRYLKGETLAVEDLPSTHNKGWQLVCVDGFPLGWAKRAGSQLKNKYYAGWRWQ